MTENYQPNSSQSLLGRLDNLVFKGIKFWTNPIEEKPKDIDSRLETIIGADIYSDSPAEISADHEIIIGQ